ARVLSINQSRGNCCPSGDALRASTLLSIYCSAAAHVSRMRSAMETGVSTGFAVLDLSLIIVGELAAEAVVNLPGFINPAADVFAVPTIGIGLPGGAIFIDASIRANALLFLCHFCSPFVFDGLGIGCRL